MGCGASAPSGRPAALSPGAGFGGPALGVGTSRRGLMTPVRGGSSGGGGAGGCLLDGPGPHTPSSLHARREDFWLTRTTGSAQVWSSLKLACEASLAGDAALVATVLEAVDLRAAVRGDLSCVYEASGRAYEIPAWCWREPANLVSEEAAAREAAAATRARRGVVGPPASLTATMRLSAGPASSEQDVPLPLRSDMTAAAVCAALHAHLLAGRADQVRDTSSPRANVWSTGGGLPANRQRLVFRGRMLAADVTVHEAGVTDGDVVQVFVKAA